MNCIVDLEPWGERFWRDAETLALDHFDEVDGGVEPNRKMKLDKKLMGFIADAGSLKIITARLDGCMVGYYTWNIALDIESEGLLIAQQGAWYLAPGYPRVAFKMFNKSLEILRSFGVQCVYPHHRTQGRGSHLGKFFKRRGAKEIQHTYSLWIGA